MFTYILLISGIGLFAFIESSGFNDLRIKKYKGLLIYITFAILLVFIGLRYKVGADWLQYYIYYDKVESVWTILFDAKNAPYFYDHNWEPGFKLLMSLGKSAGLEFEVVIFLITAFNLYSLNRFLKQYLKTDVNLFLVLFLSLNMLREFDILRQSLAFYIMLFAYQYINKSFIKYLLICLVAAMFHTSAVIFIPLYWFLGMRVKRNFLIFTLIAFILSLALRLRILTILVGIMEKALPGGSAAFFLHQVKLYLDFYPVQSNINFVTMICVVFLLVLIVFYKKTTSFDQRFVVAFLIFVYLSMVLSEIGEIQSRFGYYFTIGLAYCAWSILTLFRRYARMAYVILVVFYADVKIILPFRIEATMLTYTPYRNYLFHLDRDERTEQEIITRHAESQEKSKDIFNDKPTD
ncbi:EpsG family protein [Mucilaginibacter sp.]|uniref:EpsG family protein n=1 Tax=Mucilaginibacter sp. TaxID=1882438 RepID=UPI00284E070E|nr:EpsG family protein [Mucilaginibacter sp.]MDR3694920.1 EpsG family protein [Mucilaginibacter sp.]